MALTGFNAIDCIERVVWAELCGAVKKHPGVLWSKTLAKYFLR